MDINGTPVLLEARRGCGYRKAGGLYLMSGSLWTDCCFLPVPCDVCPCCGHGLKPARGWTWVQPQPFLRDHGRPSCADQPGSAMFGQEGGFCGVAKMWRGAVDRCGLLWIGQKFYKRPADFIREGVEMGVSRRITVIPKGFEIGKTWVLLAHRSAWEDQEAKRALKEAMDGIAEGESIDPDELASLAADVWKPGIFCAFRPTEIQRVVTKAEAERAALADGMPFERLEKRGIRPVVIERKEAE